MSSQNNVFNNNVLKISNGLNDRFATCIIVRMERVKMKFKVTIFSSGNVSEGRNTDYMRQSGKYWSSTCCA